MNRIRYVVVSLVALASLPTFAQVYRCKTAAGGTEYSQVQCGKDVQFLHSHRDSVDTTKPAADPYGAYQWSARWLRKWSVLTPSNVWLRLSAYVRTLFHRQNPPVAPDQRRRLHDKNA